MKNRMAASIALWAGLTLFSPGAGSAEEATRADLLASLPPYPAQGESYVVAGGPTDYVVQAEDVLEITVYEEPQLNAKARVTGAGEINFPLLGRVDVRGLSVIEIQEKITALLGAKYLVNPQVQVFIEAYHVQMVFVTGAVNRPGSYALPIGKKSTLMEAIAMAGGFSEDAALNGTRIIRMENGEEKKIEVKAKDIVKRGDRSKDVEVYPNDVVFVPESVF